MTSSRGVARALDMVGAATKADAVTPHDTNPLSSPCRSLYVGGTGDVKVTTVGGDTVTFSAVPAGTILPVQCKIVFSTGTTATLLLALS